MKGINTGSSDFADLIENGAIYVDKTAYMHRMISDKNNKVLFISRPRRFGKSLTISALKYLFEGRRDLFRGLAIDKSDWKWQIHPVIHFRFNELNTANADEFSADFEKYVNGRLMDAGFECDDSQSCWLNFASAIECLHAQSVRAHKADPEHRGEGVVILIDEYDAPVGHALDDIPKAKAVRARMSSLYSQMKDRTGCIRFLLMTGISKFTKLSVFSALSNIRDISQLDEYATMFGYTEEELTANFEEHLREHAAKMGKSYEDYREELKLWYNGFRFSPDVETTVYNPISIAYTLSEKPASGFKATWATTGRPSMLMNYLGREDVSSLDWENGVEAAEEEFDVADLEKLTATAMFYQAGYLTIRNYDSGLYTLGVPDEEVRRDMAKLTVGAMADENMAWAASLGVKLLTADWPKFFVGLKSLYAHLPYGPTEESVQEFSYERVLCTLLASQGIRVVTEDRQSSGRSDIVATHKRAIYVFELKVGEPVDEAFRQIREKGYADPYVATGKPIWLVGLSFDRDSRKLVECAAEPYMKA